MSQPFPGAFQPVVGPSGLFTSPWVLWLAQFAQQPGAITTALVGASPWTFTASTKGDLVLSGGTVTTVTLTRGGTTAPFGTQRTVPMANNDVATVTYSGALTASFIPS